jgi:hypothetical protein
MKKTFFRKFATIGLSLLLLGSFALNVCAADDFNTILPKYSGNTDLASDYRNYQNGGVKVYSVGGDDNGYINCWVRTGANGSGSKISDSYTVYEADDPEYTTIYSTGSTGSTVYLRGDNGHSELVNCSVSGRFYH